MAGTGSQDDVARRPKSTAVGNVCPLCGDSFQRLARHMDVVHSVNLTKQLELLRTHMCISTDRLNEFPANCRAKLVSLLEECGHIVSEDDSDNNSITSEPAEVPNRPAAENTETSAEREIPDLSRFDFTEDTDEVVEPQAEPPATPPAAGVLHVGLAVGGENSEVPRNEDGAEAGAVDQEGHDNPLDQLDDSESDGFAELLQSYSDNSSGLLRLKKPSKVAMQKAGLYARISHEKVKVLGENFFQFLSERITEEKQLLQIIHEVGQILHFQLQASRISPSALKSLDSTRIFVAQQQDTVFVFERKLSNCETSPSNVMNYLKAYSRFVKFLITCKRIGSQTKSHLEHLSKRLADQTGVQQKAANELRAESDALKPMQADFGTMIAFLKHPRVRQRLDEILKKSCASEADYMFLLRYLICVVNCKTGQRSGVAMNFTLKQFGNKQEDIDDETGDVYTIFPLAKTKVKNGRGHQFVVDQYDYKLMELYARKFRKMYRSKMVEYLAELAIKRKAKKPIPEPFFISKTGKHVRSSECVVAFQAIDLGMKVAYRAGEIRQALVTTANNMGLSKRQLLDLNFTQLHSFETSQNHYKTNKTPVVASGYRLARLVSEWDGKRKQPADSGATKRQRTDADLSAARADVSGDAAGSVTVGDLRDVDLPPAAVQCPEGNFVDDTDEVIADGILFADDHITAEPEPNIDDWKELNVTTAEELLGKYKNSSSKYLDSFKAAFFRRFPVDIDENFTMRLEDLRRILPHSLKAEPSTVAARNLQDLWKGELLKQRLAQLECDCYNSTDKAEVVVRRQLAKRGWTIANKKLQQFFSILKASGPVKQSHQLAADPTESDPKERSMSSAGLNNSNQQEFCESGSLPKTPVKADRVYSRNRLSPLKSAAYSQQQDAQLSDADHSSANCLQNLKAVISQYSSSHHPDRPYLHPNTTEQGTEEGMCAARAIAGSLIGCGAEKPRMKKLTASVVKELRSYSKDQSWFTFEEVVLYFLRRMPFTPFVVLNCQPSEKTHLYSFGASETEPHKVAVVALCGNHFAYACKPNENGAKRIKAAIEFDGPEVKVRTIADVDESREHLSGVQATLREIYMSMSERERAAENIKEGWFDPAIPLHAEVWAEMQEQEMVLEKPKHKKKKKKKKQNN